MLFCDVFWYVQVEEGEEEEKGGKEEEEATFSIATLASVTIFSAKGNWGRRGYGVAWGLL